MRKLALSVVVALAVLVPAAAQASVVVEASLGRGYQIKPTTSSNLPTNIMIAPGVGLGDVLKLELGMVWDMPHSGQGNQFRLRPMLVLNPPIIPIYGRLICGVTDVFGDNRGFEFGGAVGVSVSLLGLGIFGEVGYLPERIHSTTLTVVEGRVGAYFVF
jgi:hypothetical protein